MRALDRFVVAILLLAMTLLLLAVAHLEMGRNTPPRASAVLGVTFGRGAGVPPLVVDSLRPGGLAARAGLEIGDRIEQVDGTPATIDGLYRDVARQRAIDIAVRRGEHDLRVRVAATTGGRLE